MHFALLVQIVAHAGWGWLGSFGETFAKSAGGVLVTSIWQGAVIVCGLEIAMRLMPRVSAAYRFAVWATGFSIAAMLPLLPLLHFGQGTAGTGSALPGLGGFGSGQAGPLLQLDVRWGLAVAGLWVVASAIRATGLAVHSVKLRRLWKAARPVEAPESLVAAVREVRGRAVICTTEMLDRPSVIGFLAPRILIPDWLMARLSPGELEQIVLHEAEHLRRGDDWTNLLQKLCLVVFPLNPALAWMEHRLCREREMACDEGVVRITNAPRAYAACLASIAERGFERRAEALSLGAWQRRSELAARVHRILLRKRGVSRTTAGALLGAVGCMLVAGSVEMARCPQLVAFVSPQNNLAMTPERKQELSALLARENAEANFVTPSNFHAVQAKAVMPPARRTAMTPAFKHEVRRALKEGQDKRGTPATAQMAKTDVSGDRVNPDPNQQWVVLAAWEEVQTVSRSTDSVADYDGPADAGSRNGGLQSNASSASSGSASQGKDIAAGSSRSDGKASAGQYTITRLILRVVPANSNSTSTQPTSIHGGWLVFQL